MTATNVIASNSGVRLIAEPIDKGAIPELLDAAGPCLTLLLPPYRPGEPADPPAVLLKPYLQEAAAKLASRGIAEPMISELIEPLQHWSHEERAQAGSGLARVIFRSGTVLREFELPVLPASAPACVVGDCFWIRPLLLSLALPGNIYVLEVTKKAVALLKCGVTELTGVDLPKGTPATLDEAMGFDQPDHELVNRSSSGPSTGAMHGVQFGTGSGRETQHAHLHDFYRAVDRGVSQLLHSSQSPLILAGVDEAMAIYRSVATYPYLLKQGMHGSSGAGVVAEEVLRHAHDIALFDYQERTAATLAESKENLSPVRFSIEQNGDLDGILRAATEGRVSDLYLDEDRQRIGTFDGKVFGGRTNWHGEDLLNIAALETLLRGGAVYPLPTHLMPSDAMAAAAFRY